MKDVIIIGAGIAGSYIARELMRYRLDVLIVDKENDIANETTMANSAIVHAGYDAKVASLKSRYNIAGNPMFTELCKCLDVPFQRIGSLVIAFGNEDEKILKKLYDQGVAQGVEGMSLIDAEELRRLEPHISDQVTKALYARSAGIVSPYELAIALAENAMDNGAQCQLNTRVEGIDKIEDGFLLHTDQGDYKTRYVINCAGVYADEIAKMVGDESFKIRPKKGHYYVLDKGASKLFHHTIFQCPSDKGKGVLITPTVHGNVLIGPDAEYVFDKEDSKTEREHLAMVAEIAKKTSVEIPFDKVIRSFAGLRASSDRGDFIIGESEAAKGFINVAGFESPGLSSVPAVAVDVVKMLGEIDGSFVLNDKFNPRRKAVVRFMELDDEGKKNAIKSDPSFGHIICRCEMVTEAEIVDCIHRNAGATTVKGVKKRTRPGMGRCQGGFCGPRVVEILARELKIPMEEVVYDTSEAYIIRKASKGVDRKVDEDENC